MCDLFSPCTGCDVSIRSAAAMRYLFLSLSPSLSLLLSCVSFAFVVCPFVVAVSVGGRLCFRNSVPSACRPPVLVLQPLRLLHARA